MSVRLVTSRSILATVATGFTLLAVVGCGTDQAPGGTLDKQGGGGPAVSTSPPPPPPHSPDTNVHRTSLTLSKSTVYDGDSYTASASGFAAGEQIRFAWTGDSSGTIATKTANDRGKASVVVTEYATPGQYRITATGLSSGRQASSALSVRKPAEAVLTLSASAVYNGDSYTASASGFAAGEQVRFSWTGDSSGTIATKTANDRGNVSIVVSENAGAGSYTITATGLTSGRSASAPLSVVLNGKPYQVTLTLSKTTVADGSTYVAYGSGFAAGEQVQFTWTGPSSGTIGTEPADDRGNVSIVVSENAAPGDYTIIATGLSSGWSAAASLQVTSG
jgi:hypothetical protein